ncbi:MAG: hypothetical protein AAB631_01700 [Patescibacteria group bacterium]
MAKKLLGDVLEIDDIEYLVTADALEALKKLSEYAAVEEVREAKAKEKGAFDERIILKGEKD